MKFVEIVIGLLLLLVYDGLIVEASFVINLCDCLLYLLHFLIINISSTFNDLDNLKMHIYFVLEDIVLV